MKADVGAPLAPSGLGALLRLPAYGRKIGGAAEYIVIPALALAGSLVLFGIFVALFGKNPLDLYFYMYQGAFGTWFSWQNTLTRAAPLILTALCTALPAQLGMVIIGGEGALLDRRADGDQRGAGIASAPPLFVDVAMACAGMIGGGLWIMLVRRAAPVSRRQRNDFEPVARLYRARDPQFSGRRARCATRPASTSPQRRRSAPPI